MFPDRYVERNVGEFVYRQGGMHNFNYAHALGLAWCILLTSSMTVAATHVGLKKSFSYFSLFVFIVL